MNVAIILGAGKGERFGSPIPKQFVKLGNKMIIQHTIDAFYYHPHVDVICVAVPQEHVVMFDELCRAEYSLTKEIIVIPGGHSRQRSTQLVLARMQECLSDDDIVLIHDAVRPFVSERIISENIMAAKRFGAVDTVIPAEDTIVESEAGGSIDRIDRRSKFYLGQTPQSFRFGLISTAYALASPETIGKVTDDASLVLPIHPVHLVAGEKQNFKITTSWDLFVAESLFFALSKHNNWDVEVKHFT